MRIMLAGAAFAASALAPSLVMCSRSVGTTEKEDEHII
jgi:hypothetical protein